MNIILDMKSRNDLDILRTLKRNKKRRGNDWVQAYKYVCKDGTSPISSRPIRYVAGRKYWVKNACTDPRQDCAGGINLADLRWCNAWKRGRHKIMEFYFQVKDIAAIPTNSDGKFRVFKCKAAPVPPSWFEKLMSGLGF